MFYSSVWIILQQRLAYADSAVEAMWALPQAKVSVVGIATAFAAFVSDLSLGGVELLLQLYDRCCY